MPLFVNDGTPVMNTSAVCMVPERQGEQGCSTVNTWSSARAITTIDETGCEAQHGLLRLSPRRSNN
jgi:hypothetical protein